MSGHPRAPLGVAGWYEFGTQKSCENFERDAARVYWTITHEVPKCIIRLCDSEYRLLQFIPWYLQAWSTICEKFASSAELCLDGCDRRLHYEVKFCLALTSGFMKCFLWFANYFADIPMEEIWKYNTYSFQLLFAVFLWNLQHLLKLIFLFFLQKNSKVRRCTRSVAGQQP